MEYLACTSEGRKAAYKLLKRVSRGGNGVEGTEPDAAGVLKKSGRSKSTVEDAIQTGSTASAMGCALVPA